MKATRELVKKIYAIVAELNEAHAHRNFTPDGILVGSIGEVLAEYHYGLEPLPPGTPAHDCRHGNVLIQIKTTQRATIQIGEPCQHLIAQKLLPTGEVEEVYNGPGLLVWDLVKEKPRPKNGLYQIGFGKLRKLMKDMPDGVAISRVAP